MMDSLTYRAPVALFLFFFTFFYLMGTLESPISGDNENVKEDLVRPWIRLVYWVLLKLDVTFFKLVFLATVSAGSSFAYLAAKNELGGFLFAFWWPTYFRTVFYTLGQDSMVFMVALIFLYLWRPSWKTAIICGAHRVEYLVLVLIHGRRILWLLPLAAFLWADPWLYGCSSRTFYALIQHFVEDLGWYFPVLIIAGICGLLYAQNGPISFAVAWSLIWPFIYGNPNTRYLLAFFALLYWLAFQIVGKMLTPLSKWAFSEIADLFYKKL